MKKSKSSKRVNRLFVAILAVVIVAALGTTWAYMSHAAGTYLSQEPESGTLTNGAVKVNDTTASASQAIRFGDLPANNTGPVVYFVPHQDDETLSMGSSIEAHVAEGREVYVVIVTDGSASVAKSKLAAEGYSLTTSQFIAARDTEVKAALADLGVPRSHIFFEYKVDGTLTRAQADTIIRKYAGLYPNGSYKTMSWLDKHPDHYNLGYALNSLCIIGTVLQDCRFYQNLDYNMENTTQPASNKVPTPAGGWERSFTKVPAAIAEYRLFNPSLGRYAIGGKYSAKPAFDYLAEHPGSWYHKDNNSWRTDADKAQAQTWLSANQ